MLIPRQLSYASGSMKECWLCCHSPPLTFLLTVLSTACYNTSCHICNIWNKGRPFKGILAEGNSLELG